MSAGFDYSGLKSTADRLIARFGRAATLRRASQSTADPANDPLGPPNSSGTDIQTIPVTAVFLDLERDAFTTTGAGIGRGSTPVEEKNVRVLVEAATELPEEMGTEWTLIDGTRLWKVRLARPVAPGDTLLYYELEVRQ